MPVGDYDFPSLNGPGQIIQLYGIVNHFLCVHIQMRLPIYLNYNRRRISSLAFDF